jgi:hypothetical protein
MRTFWLFLGALVLVAAPTDGASDELVTRPLFLDFEYATPQTKLGHIPGFRLETDDECASWCATYDECCTATIAEQYYGVQMKPADVVYLRGEVAGVAARVGASVAALDDGAKRLIRLDIDLVGMPDFKPRPDGLAPQETPPALLDSPVGAWCVKTWGAPQALKETKSRSKAVWRPSGLVVRLARVEARTGCRCPIGSKCRCASEVYTRHSLSIQWK